MNVVADFGVGEQSEFIARGNVMCCIKSNPSNIFSSSCSNGIHYYLRCNLNALLTALCQYKHIPGKLQFRSLFTDQYNFMLLLLLDLL